MEVCWWLNLKVEETIKELNDIDAKLSTTNEQNEEVIERKRVHSIRYGETFNTRKV